MKRSLFLVLFAVSTQSIAIDYNDCVNSMGRLVKIAKNSSHSHGDSMEYILSSLSEIESALNKTKRSCSSQDAKSSICNTASRLAITNGIEAAQILCKSSTDIDSFEFCMMCATTTK